MSTSRSIPQDAGRRARQTALLAHPDLSPPQVPAAEYLAGLIEADGNVWCLRYGAGKLVNYWHLPSAGLAAGGCTVDFSKYGRVVFSVADAVRERLAPDWIQLLGLLIGAERIEQ